MAQQLINNGDTGLAARTKINANDSELYARDNVSQAEVTANTAKISYTDAAAVAANTAFRGTPSSIITAGTNLSWAGNTLNATGGGGVAWGAISGTLSAQTDLQNELDAKQNTISDSDDISEGVVNLFLTTTERLNIATNNAKVSNVNTNLSFSRDATTVTVESSDGANAILPEANTTNAGILGSGKWDEIVANTAKISYTDAAAVGLNTTHRSSDGKNHSDVVTNNAKVSNVSTNLSEGTTTETTVDVNSSDGTNGTLVSASASRAGLLTKAKFDEIVANNAKVSYSDSGNVVLKTTNQTVEGEKTFSDNLKVNAQANAGHNIKTFTASATFNADDGNNQYMEVTASTNVGISDELPGIMIIELEINSGGSPTITPNANLGTVMDNSAAFINADNDINIITIYINPNGAKRYSVNTIAA